MTIEIGEGDFPSGASSEPPETEKTTVWNGRKVSNWITSGLKAIGRGLSDPDLFDFDAPLPSGKTSSKFCVPGMRETHLRIGGINGMNNSEKEAFAHAKYTAQFAQGHHIDWIHNHSHGAVVDVLEIFTMNFFGFSPNTASLLRENWESFHRENGMRPHAKYLQLCHSQGAIHVRNELARAPKALRDRIIVVAIAPAAVIPKELCFNAFNYACRRDIVPCGEFILATTPKRIEISELFRKELIRLNPEGTSGLGHEYQNPLFAEKIRDHIQEYLERGGEFI